MAILQLYIYGKNVSNRALYETTSCCVLYSYVRHGDSEKGISRSLIIVRPRAYPFYIWTMMLLLQQLQTLKKLCEVGVCISKLVV